MNQAITIVNLLFYSQTVLGRDWYMGIFRKDDFLVAQDTLYKDKVTFSHVRAHYGRSFKCPITYCRVVDRLGMPGDSSVRILRGGLLKKYISLLITSDYDEPIAVNIYVACENKHPRKPIRPNRTVATTKKTFKPKIIREESKWLTTKKTEANNTVDEKTQTPTVIPSTETVAQKEGETNDKGVTSTGEVNAGTGSTVQSVTGEETTVATP